MNKDQLKGKVDNIKGRVKDAAGSLTGDKEQQAEGMVDRAKGAAREAYGDVKERLDRDTPENPPTRTETTRTVEESEDE